MLATSALFVVSPLSTGVAGAAAAPRAAGYFKTLPPGASSRAASSARRAHPPFDLGTAPQNKAANHKVLKPAGLPNNTAFNTAWQRKYKPRINGKFQGTTDEIIQWASCKWGIGDNLTRAPRGVGVGLGAVDGGRLHVAPELLPAGLEDAAVPHLVRAVAVEVELPARYVPAHQGQHRVQSRLPLAEMRGCLDGMMWFGTRFAR